MRGSRKRRSCSPWGLLCGFFGAALALGGALAACGERTDNPPARNSGNGGQTTPDGGTLAPDDETGPPPPDAGGLCGNQLHELITDAPNIYFVLDASGSMSTAVTSQDNRYDRVRKAAIDLVRRLGPLINVGAAVFPLDATPDDTCARGGEVLAVSRGDGFAGEGVDGMTTLAFATATRMTPVGGTPTAATLEALTATLAALDGKTIVLLATDGGPNCNPSESCAADECIANIEGQCPDTNCCTPDGLSGPQGCIDRAATVEAIAQLATLGIDVYVIGIPGSEIYRDVLDEMALAGRVSQFVSPFYYKVDDMDALGSVLSKIASVVVSCEFDLVDPPPKQGLTNVYFDSELVPYDSIDGWFWKRPSVVELRGDACQRLKDGRVKQIQIVSGCQTEVAR